MGVPSDDVVLIQKPKKSGEPFVITVNCPDKTGLGCDICRTILDFGLYITKGDVSTDGIWCYIVLWVLPHSSSPTVRWSNLKNRLISECPSSCSVSFYLNQQPAPSSAPPVYLLKFLSLDRRGLLYDVTQVLCELELSIQRVKVTTTPDNSVLDLFFITDNLNLLQTKSRQDETCQQLHAVLGESCISCELQLAGPEYQGCHAISSLSPVVVEELFRCELLDDEVRSQALSPDLSKLKKTSIAIDNALSPAHTLLQIHCVDHKGFLYDIMRTLKDRSLQVKVDLFPLKAYPVEKVSHMPPLNPKIFENFFKLSLENLKFSEQLHHHLPHPKPLKNKIKENIMLSAADRTSIYHLSYQLAAA